MKKKLFNVLCTLMICVMAVFTLCMLLGKFNHRVTFVGNRAILWVMTGSMEDTIPARSYILIEKVENAEAEIREGDIITFYSTDPNIRGQLNTHEVVGIDRDEGNFTTKGKNNPTADEAKVPYENTVGRYVRNLPLLTVLGRFMMTRGGFIATILVLLALVCAVYLPDILRAFRTRTEETPDVRNDEAAHEAEIRRRIEEEVERLRQQDLSQREPTEEAADASSAASVAQDPSYDDPTDRTTSDQ